VYTADPARPWAESVAVRGEQILAVGGRRELDDLRGPRTQVFDMEGSLLLPGFTESHIHFIELALRGTQLDVTGARSAAEVAESVRAYRELPENPGAANSGAWIRGGGWSVDRWTDAAAPHKALLDAVAPDLPVALDGKELHSLWLNSAALHRAGITAATGDVPGGVIDRDSTGEPTGILRDNAVTLAQRVYPPPELRQTMAAVRSSIPALWRTGIVAIHNANDTLDGLALRTYEGLHCRRELHVRVLQHIPAGNLAHARAIGLRSGLGDAWLRIGGIKMFADGALGSRTALMQQPYVGEPGHWGVATLDPEEMLEQALLASASGLSLTIHAIGDRANHDVLDVLAEVRLQETAHPLRRDEPLRHRIEHVQCIDFADLPRLAQLNIIGSVQPIHATSDMVMLDAHWGGERARRSYAFRSLLRSGARLVFGSDGPIEPHAPLAGIHAAVTRRRADGSPGAAGWQGQERVEVSDAIDAYTRWPAYAAREEDYRGSISPGKLADLVMLSRDIFTIDPMEILATQVEMTVIGGVVVWRRG